MKLNTLKQEEDKFLETGRKDPDIEITREKGLKIMTIMVRTQSMENLKKFLCRPVATVERSFVTEHVLFLTMIYTR